MIEVQGDLTLGKNAHHLGDVTVQAGITIPPGQTLQADSITIGPRRPRRLRRLLNRWAWARRRWDRKQQVLITFTNASLYPSPPWAPTPPPPVRRSSQRSLALWLLDRYR